MSMLQEIEGVRFSANVGQLDSIAPQSLWPAWDDVDGYRLKRMIDICGAVAALAFFAPVMIIIYALLTCSGGNPIFAHHRVGRNGELFLCYKFRSMVNNANKVLADYLNSNPDAQEEWNEKFKLARDPRISPFGSFLRRASLDELPQLFNVLKGEMSLVGPRPIVPTEIARYADRIKAYYRCRPGITGLWQVSGRNEVAYAKRVRLDALYARKRSVRLDTVILLRTVRAVISCRGAY